MFERRPDGFPLLNEGDESTGFRAVPLRSGSATRRPRLLLHLQVPNGFAVVAKAIATSLGMPAHALEEYRDWGMYLDDLSCCGEECIC